MLFLDYVLIAFIMLGAWKGKTRGFVDELKSFINTLMLMGVMSGVWSFTIVKDFVVSIMKLHPLTAGIGGAIMAFITACWLLNLLRNQLPEKLGESMGDARQASLGAILGFSRRIVMVSFLLFISVTAPSEQVRSMAQQFSYAAQFLTQSIERYRPKHSQLPLKRVIESPVPDSEPTKAEPVDSTMMDDTETMLFYE